MENSIEVPKQTNKQKTLRVELPYDPENPLLGKYPEKIIIPKETVLQRSLQHYLQ